MFSSIFTILLLGSVLFSTLGSIIELTSNFTQTMTLVGEKYSYFYFHLPSNEAFYGHLQVTIRPTSGSNMWGSLFFGNRCDQGIIMEPNITNNCMWNRHSAKYYFENETAIYFSLYPNMDGQYDIEVTISPIIILTESINYRFYSEAGWETKFQLKIDFEVPATMEIYLNNLQDSESELAPQISFRTNTLDDDTLPECLSYRNLAFQCLVAEQGYINITISNPRISGDIEIVFNHTQIQSLRESSQLDFWLPAGFYKFFQIYTAQDEMIRISPNSLSNIGTAKMFISSPDPFYRQQCWLGFSIFPRENRYCWTTYPGDEGVFTLIPGWLGRVDWYFSVRAHSSGLYRLHYKLHVLQNIYPGYQEVVSIDPEMSEYVYYQISINSTDVPGQATMIVEPLEPNAMLNIYYDSPLCGISYIPFPWQRNYCKSSSIIPYVGQTRTLVITFTSPTNAYFSVQGKTKGNYKISLLY